MRRRSVRGILGFAAFSLAVCVAAASLGMFVHGEVDSSRRGEANSALSFFQQAMTLKLRGSLSQTGELAAVVAADPDDDARFAEAAGQLLGREEVSFVAYVQDETMRAAYPEDAFGAMAGQNLNRFSYIYTVAKVTDDFVVEGPTALANGDEVFMFIQPIDVEGSYYGEVAVALEAAYVIGQLDFASLEEAGYRYELWAVSPQDGSKDVIAASEGGYDFSKASRLSFNMPTLWTLSIMPADGWVPANWTMGIAAAFASLALLAIGVVGLSLRMRRLRRQRDEERRIDPETGLLAYGGFVEQLGRETARRKAPRQLTLVCLMVDDFERTALSLGWEERHRYLRGARDEIALVVRGDYLAARVSGGCFVIALREHVDRRTLGDLMRGLELAMLWKVRIDGKKVFCRARSAAVYCPEDGEDPIALVERTVSLLERDKPEGPSRR